MHLKALKLQGFKSFADPTTLRFEPGVTAVVGPNGCGKSNIADSIRWVLGEQSAKALRGGKMQDVIFEGADTRKPAQLCEVSLLLTECEKQLGSEFHEIEITRRVHRDGQSEYFFNGQACRLKDIQKLFMDTGIGRTSYSIMAQGQIDQILSSKPEERRAVFEEAAGITKYKSQRREALQKLTLTDQNLARVSDVIAEVGRQIGSLRRQASKALRYKKLSYRLRHLALAHAGQQHAVLSTALAALEENVIKLRAAAETRRIELQQRQSEMEERRANRSRLNQRVQDAQQAVFDLRSEKEQAENNANLATIKRTGLADRLDSSQQSLSELDMQIRELANQVDSGAQDKQLQLELLGSSDSTFQNRNRELTVVEGELTKLEQDLQQSKFSLLQLESNVARLRTDCSGYEVDQKTSTHKHEAVLAEIENVRQQQSSTAQLASEFDARVEEALQEKARAHSQSQETQTAITNLTREFRDQQKKLQDIDRQLAQRTARLRLLQQLQEKWEGFGEGSKALLQGRLDAALAGTKATPITHGLEVRPDCAKALEALLGSTVEAISVADLDTAQRILTQLENEQIGAAVLQVPNLSPITPNQSSLPAFLQPATTALINTAENHPAVALLGACFIADDLHAFLAFWKENPAFNFLAVATRKGEVVDRRGLISGGHQKKPAASILQREVDLRETSKGLADDQKAHDDQKLVIDSINARLSEAESRLEQDRADILSATQNLASVQSEQRTIQKQVEEISARLGRMENELSSLENVRAEAESRFAKAQATLQEVEANIVAGRERIHQTETRINELRTDRDIRRDTLGQARLELAERRQKVEVLDRGLADMERRRRQMSELLIQRQQEVETWTDQVAQLEREADAQRARSAQLAESLVVAQNQVEQIRHELVELERSMGDSENSQYNLRTESDQAQSELSKCEIKLAETKSRAQFIEEDVQREFQIRVGTYDWRALLWKSDEDPPDLKQLDLDDEDEESEVGSAGLPSGSEPSPTATTGDAASPEATASEAAAAPAKRRRKKTPKPDATEEDLQKLETSTDWNALKAEIEAIRQRLGNMGAVNVLAIDEYAELKQRYDFLKGQNDDLTNSKSELLKAIDEINQTSQQQFAITFEQIRKNFVYTFQTLFGGGVANLELVQQSDDPLECGIEITAQPPGTKLKSITLLSGGQKTLTAVGLLFALYMVKPSPFCLLDELDAPLDESNIGRFTDLLKKFVHDSQFIIITHNKRTVAAANAIYGVTMEERGVSKTVSMKFNHLLGEPEAPQQNIAEAVRGTRAPVGV